MQELLARYIMERHSSIKRTLSRRLFRMIVGRKFEPYNWNDNGENWLLNRLAAFHPAIVFDVGANVGEWSVLARRALPKAQIHSFEIVDSTYALLRESLIGVEGIVLNNFGLSDQSGVMSMRLPDSSNAHASHFADPGKGYPEIVCSVRRGDEYMQSAGIERVDFLKIDVEGAEHLVLNGFGAAIDHGRIDIIQFEYGKTNIVTHFLLRDFYQFLESRGYVIGKLFSDYVDVRAYKFEDEDFCGPNYVAIRKERLDIIASLRK